MAPRRGIILVQSYLVVIWTILMTSSGVVITPSQCDGRQVLLTSSADFTDLTVRGTFRSETHNCTVLIQSEACDGGVEVAYRSWNSVHHGDEMNIYDGPSTQYPSIERFYRDNNNWNRNYQHLANVYRRSSGRFATVVFLFPYNHRYRRDFTLRYRDTPKGLLPTNPGNNVTIGNTVSDTCGEITLIAFQKPNFITSPGYPREYSNSLDCKWNIISDDICNDDVIQVTIHALSIEETYDHLVIYDGDSEFDPVLAKLSGHAGPQVIMASGHSIVVEFKTDDTAPGRGFHLAYSRTMATPYLSQKVTTKKTAHMAEMSINFISSTQHRAVYWSKNDVIIPEDSTHTLTLTPTKVTSEREPDVAVDGYRATLNIAEPTSSDFGMYKVAVVNEFGISERTVLLKSGLSVPIVHNYTVISGNATITVTFSSNPNFEVEWYKTRRIITSGGDDVNVITTPVENEENDFENMYVSVLSPANPTESDYGDYMCVIRNDVGTAEIYIHLDLPETELPKLLVTTGAVELHNRHITLSVNFDSNVAYPTATWYHGNVLLGTSDKYNPEVKWEGKASQDWLTHGYPSSLSSPLFHQVVNSHTDNLVANDSYRFPTIGGSRSKTQPNANYTAVLTISDITPQDFGLYRVVLENEAGVSHFVTDVTTPEVFPYVTCEQAGTIQLVCNITSCSTTTQSWVHSVNGDVIRTLPGNQVRTVNTLDIPMCMHSDAGTYTCVATDDETGSELVIHHDKATVTVRAVPVILESTVDIQTDHLQIEVPFYSYPPHHRVRWQLNGDQISSTDHNNTESRDVQLPMHGKKCTQAGHVTSVNMPLPQYEHFGVYKITISNEMGNSEHFVEVQNPKYANPVASSDVNVTYNEGSALLKVTFTSYYPYVSVKWYFRREEVRENHPVNKYVIQTDPANDVIDSNPVVRTEQTISTVLTVTCVTEEDYGMYDVLVTNKAGKAVIPVKLGRHDEGIPKMVHEIVSRISNSVAEMNAKFHSSSGYRLIRWLKQGEEIKNDTSKYLINNMDIDIEIMSNGEKVEATGTVTKLSVMSLDEKDYGIYSLQIYNEVGMIDRSVILNEECGNT